MQNVARIFDQKTQGMRPVGPPAKTRSGEEGPWGLLAMGAMPPLMFQVRRRDGSFSSFAYSDLREVRFRDAGHVELIVGSLAPLLIEIEGRHLRDLALGFTAASVRWFQESDAERDDRAEEEAEITKVSVHSLSP